MNGKPSYTVKVNEIGIEEIILRPFRIPTDANGSMWINPNYKFTEIDYVSNVSLPDLQGRTVLVGLTAKGLAAQIPTSTGLRSAHQLQAASISTLMGQETLRRPVWADLLEIAVMAVGAVLLLLAVYYLPVWFSGSLFVILTSSLTYGYWHIWTENSILLSPLCSIVLFIITFMSASFNNFYKQFVLRQQIKKQFGTYLSPDMVNALQKDPSLLKLGGDRKEMTFLFMDICGFTPISEHYKNNDDPEGLVELVNEFLDAMTKIILANGGTIDKYMGDCIMAFWNAPLY